MHQLMASLGLTNAMAGVSPVAHSTAAAAIDDGQWSKNSMSVALHFAALRKLVPCRNNVYSQPTNMLL